MKSRILSRVLLVVMCVSLLTACDSTAGQSINESNNPTYSDTILIDGDSSVLRTSVPGSDDHTQERDSTPGNFRTFDSEQTNSQTQTAENSVVPRTAKNPTAAPSIIVDVTGFSLSAVGAYAGKAYVGVNGNTPFFTAEELTSTSFELYSDLDALGRCGTAYASVGQDLMPTEKRGSIGMVKPTGWHTVRYDDLVDGKYLYNRCHLIGYQLTGENANTSNLITGTRYLNIEGMLPFENMVADYIDETGNHVMYRVTPIFEGNNLVANGVLMEGYSVEDKGDGICFCVFAYNVQPGIEIDYATGESKLAEGVKQVEQKPAAVTPTPTPEPEKREPTSDSEAPQANYILNTNTKKFHYPTCSSVSNMKEENKQEFLGKRDEVISHGYSPCGRCKP